jgi:hypothetical protein
MDKIQEAIFTVILDYVDGIYSLRDLLVILGVFKSMRLTWTRPVRNYHNRNTKALLKIAENAHQVNGVKKISNNTYQLEMLTYKYLTSNTPYTQDMIDAFEKLKEDREKLFEETFADR